MSARRPSAGRSTAIVVLLATLTGALALSCSPRTDDSAAADDRFAAANAAFGAGQFQRSAEILEELEQSKGASSSLLFNLGNAWVRDGRFGRAILAYERALRHSPDSADIEANLRQARAAANVEAPATSLWHRLAFAATADALATGASLAWALACLFLGVRRLRRGDPGDRAGRGLRNGTAVAAVAGVVLAGLCATHLAAGDLGVVLGPDTAVRATPFPSATLGTPLPPGTLVEIEREHEGFVLVSLPDGPSGWLPRSAVGPLLP